jgi:hypothetical protein
VVLIFGFQVYVGPTQRVTSEKEKLSAGCLAVQPSNHLTVYDNL